MRAEILIDEPMAARGRLMLHAMKAAAPIETVVRKRYVGDCEILISYGPGHMGRRASIITQREIGGRFVGVDMGYWDRDGEDAGMRLTLDDDHCARWIRPEAPERWDVRGVALRNDHDPSGPILLVGQGIKSRNALGAAQYLEWEAATVNRLKRAYPGAPIVYRRKRLTDPVPRTLSAARDGPIDEVLRGARMVVCLHSNVAVDACIAGVPVVCTDGAASAIYGSDVCNPKNPSAAKRLEFLRSLAWWNWKHSEAAACWSYLLERIRSG